MTMATFFSSLTSRLRHPWSSSSPSSLISIPSTSPRPSPCLSSVTNRGQASVDETLLCVFRLLDQNNDGFVSVKEFCEGLHKLGIHIPHHQMSDLLRFNSSSGLLSFHQFQALYATLCSNPEDSDLREEKIFEGAEEGIPREEHGEAFLKHPGKQSARRTKSATVESQLNGNHDRVLGKNHKFLRKEGNFKGIEDPIDGNKENLNANESKSTGFYRNGNSFIENNKDSHANAVKLFEQEGIIHAKLDIDSHINNDSDNETEIKMRFDPNPKYEEGYCEEEDDMALLEAFSIYDQNADGFISLSELQNVLCNLGFSQCSDSNLCHEIMKKVDSNGDGLLDFCEFKNMMLHKYKSTAIYNI